MTWHVANHTFGMLRVNKSMCRAHIPRNSGTSIECIEISLTSFDRIKSSITAPIHVMTTSLRVVPYKAMSGWSSKTSGGV